MSRKKIYRKIRRFLNETEAATAVEYAVVLMLIAGACITTIQLVGGSSGASWEINKDGVEDALSR